MKSYKLYIFDIDDTLVNTLENATNYIYPELANIIGTQCPDKEMIRKHWGKNLYDSLNMLFPNSIKKDNTLHYLIKLYSQHPVHLFDGVERIFSILKKHNKFIGLFTKSTPQLIDHYFIKELNHISSKSDFILNINTEKNIKLLSHQLVEFFRMKYQSKWNESLKLNEILIIGDSIDDYLTAKNSKVDFAGVLTGKTLKSDFLKFGLSSSRIFSTVREAIKPTVNHGVVAIIWNHTNEFLMIKEGREDNPYYNHWSGPHGKCIEEDILEEETVVRESMEECNIKVRPITCLYTRSADTRIETVSFWKTIIEDEETVDMSIRNREVSEIRWISYDDIANDRVLLYRGTKDFFKNYRF